MNPLPIQTREEKEQFFRDLDALDQWTSDSENEGRPALTRKPLTALSPNMSMSSSSSIQITKVKSISPPPRPISKQSKQDTAKPSEQKVTTKSMEQKPPPKPKEKASVLNSKKRKRYPGRSHYEDIPEEKQMFKGMVFFWVPNNDVCPVRRMRIERAVSYGAVWTPDWRDDVDHILVDDGLSLSSVRARVTPEQLEKSKPLITNTRWMSECIMFQELRDEDTPRFQVHEPKPKVEPEPVPEKPKPVDRSKEPSYRTGFVLPPRKPPAEAPKPKEPQKPVYVPVNDADAAFETVVDEIRGLSALPLEVEPDESHFQSLEHAPTKKHLKQETFLCMQKNDGTKSNPNSLTIDILNQMSSYYDRNNDQWRTLAYRKAASILSKQSTLISTQEEARKLPMIGQRLAEKIEEIATTNTLRRLEVVTSDPDDQVMKLFTGVYQVGYRQARQWIMQGHRTLEDLKNKAELSTNQRIGLEHYNDFQLRIPRAEVEQHAKVVEMSLQKADPGLELIIGGSYRRGHPDSGDIDLIITKEDAGMSHIRDLINNFVLPDLQKSQFLQCVLTDDKGNGSKLHGASTLPNSPTWRRIDLLYVPWNELGAALIYFTGNDIFNRSLRLLASRKNMRLNQHGLYKDVMRGEGRKRITEGTRVAGHDEKEIFAILGVPYRPPEHRRC